MKYVFTIDNFKNKLDSSLDHEEIQKKIITLTGEFNNNYTGHLSIFHISKKKKKIWLFLYNEDGIGENENEGKDVLTKNNLVKKYKGKKPSLEAIKKLF